MTQQYHLEAKQGNPKAIAALINRQLQSKGITAKANLRDDCLIIMLESSQVLEQQSFVAFIQRGMTALNPKSIKFVKVYGLQIDEELPLWYQDIELMTPDISKLPLVKKLSDTCDSTKKRAKQKFEETVVDQKYKTSQLKVKAREFINYLLEFEEQLLNRRFNNQITSSSDDPITKLEKLKKLLDKKIITEQEFQIKKWELLDRV